MGKINLKLFIFSILLLAGFFGFEGKCWAEENDLIITEIMHAPAKNEAGEKVEWIELYANADKNFILKSNKQLKDFYFCAKKGSSENSCASSNYYAAYSLEEELSMEKGTFAIATSKPEIFSDIKNIKIIKTSSSFNLLSNDDAFIAYSNDNKLTWKENIKYSDYFGEKKEGYSLERINLNENDWQESYILGGTPGKENSKKLKEEPEEDPVPPEPEIKDYSGKIRISELLPNPKETPEKEKEFVELYNFGNENVDLSGWKIKDKTGSYDLSGVSVAESYKAFYNTVSLNNSGDEIKLFDPNDKEVDSINYDKSKENYSYSLNGENWKWTSILTPNQENQFDEILSGTIKKDKNIYAGIYADFEAKAGNNAKKFTWNFGDGHKSYLQKTRHKYEDTGDYSASLKITGDGEDNVLNFVVTVEDFKKAKIKIVSFSANPAGKDSEKEWIKIINNTKKKVNLKGWSVATGWKKLSNHPIKKDFILKPKETKKLTRDLCAFSLGNKQAKIELRYPNGKVADKIKYDRKKDSIKEDEIYQKDGKKWQWVKMQTNMDTTLTNVDETPTDTENIVIEEKKDEPVLESADFDLSDLGKYSENPEWNFKRKKQIAFIFAGSKINPEEKLLQNQGRVLGISMTRSYTKPAEKNNLQNFSGQIWKKINMRMNRIVSAF